MNNFLINEEGFLTDEEDFEIVMKTLIVGFHFILTVMASKVIAFYVMKYPDMWIDCIIAFAFVQLAVYVYIKEHKKRT